MAKRLSTTRSIIGSLALLATAGASAGCDTILAAIPEIGFCGDTAPTAELLKLGEGPALFVDAVRQVGLEVGAQTGAIGGGMAKGFDVSRQALDALGPYQYQGTGSYKRDVASDRAFRLRFFYGDGVPGKAAGTPLEADLTKLDSYVSVGNLLDPSGGKGPLFPLVDATGLTGGTLKFNDAALRFDLGSLVTANLKGYGLQLALGTKQASPGELVKQIADKKLAFSLADTAMTNPAHGFSLTVKKFDLTYGLDGQAALGGDYQFEVKNGALKYFGAVTTTGGVPFVSLRCGETASSEFATIAFASGKADFKIRTENFPITLPGLAPLKEALQ